MMEKVFFCRASAWIVLGGVLCGAAASGAQDCSVVQKCVEIKNDIARLQCFDAAAEMNGSTTGADDGQEEATETSDDQVSTEATDASATADKGETKAAPAASPASAEVPKKKGPVTKRYRPTDPKAVIEADERMVEQCEFLGSVTGKSGWGGLAAGAASKGTKRSATKKAARMGATHIVFGNFNNGSGITLQTSNREARAYRCKDGD